MNETAITYLSGFGNEFATEALPGALPVTLANGETRTFLEDGDAVILRGWCEKPGAPRLGFGKCIGTVLPALSDILAV